MAKSEAKLDRAKAQAAEALAHIKEAGGARAYCIEYLHHLANLKSDDDADVVIRDRKAAFPKMAVQLAAVAAVRSTQGSETQGQDRRWARAAWVHSAGHYIDQPSADDTEVVFHSNAQAMSMLRKSADVRKAKAAEQWDRLVDKDLDSLGSIALFGREPEAPTTRRERWGAVAILAGLLAAAAAYGASNWYLSTKITEPYQTRAGIQQRRDATDRVLDHERVMSSTARRSGIFKLVLDWPMSPTAAELDAFSEYAGDIIGLYKTLVAEKIICGSSDLTVDQATGVVQKVNDDISLQDEILDPFPLADSLIIKSLARLYPCSK